MRDHFKQKLSKQYKEPAYKLTEEQIAKFDMVLPGKVTTKAVFKIVNDQRNLMKDSKGIRQKVNLIKTLIEDKVEEKQRAKIAKENGDTARKPNCTKPRVLCEYKSYISSKVPRVFKECSSK